MLYSSITVITETSTKQKKTKKHGITVHESYAPRVPVCHVTHLGHVHRATLISLWTPECTITFLCISMTFFMAE